MHALGSFDRRSSGKQSKPGINEKSIRITTWMRCNTRNCQAAWRSNSASAAGAGALARDIRVRGRRATGHSTRHFLAVARKWLLELLAFGVLRRRGVPVVDNLQKENEIEREARHEAVEDERVVDLLEGGEDAGKRAEEVVDDLWFC